MRELSWPIDPGVLNVVKEFARPIDPGLFRVIQQAAIATAEWSRLLQDVTKQRQLERDLLPKLARRGWLISPSGPASQPDALHSLFEKGGAAAIDVYLLDLLDDYACRQIVVDVTKPKAPFVRWRATFEKALAAMERGDHELAIPVFLAGLESACLRTFHIPKVYSADEAKTRRLVAQQWTKLSEIHEPLALAWLEVLIGVSGPPRGPALLNRHAIMHGDRPQVGSRKDAVQCILAIEVLSYLATERSRSPPQKRALSEVGNRSDTKRQIRR
jgi:hypothetical protein